MAEVPPNLPSKGWPSPAHLYCRECLLPCTPLTLDASKLLSFCKADRQKSSRFNLHFPNFSWVEHLFTHLCVICESPVHMYVSHPFSLLCHLMFPDGFIIVLFKTWILSLCYSHYKYFPLMFCKKLSLMAAYHSLSRTLWDLLACRWVDEHEAEPA